MWVNYIIYYQLITAIAIICFMVDNSKSCIRFILMYKIFNSYELQPINSQLLYIQPKFTYFLSFREKKINFEDKIHYCNKIEVLF